MARSTRSEEKGRGLLMEVERLKWEVVRHRERLKEAEKGRARAAAEAATWQKKIVALSEHYRRRVRHLTEWSERLGSQRVEREQEARRLSEELKRCESERDRLRRSLERFQGEALSLFLGGALEEAPSGESVRSLSRGEESERRILTLIASRRDTAVPAGNGTTGD